VFEDNNINTHTDTVICYIGKCIDDVVLKISVRTFPNQKPWINGEVRGKLKARTIAPRAGDLEEYRKSRYELRRAISRAKRQYKDKVESDFKGCNTRNMWAGLRTMTDYKGAAGGAAGLSACASLPDELNCFFARFESSQAGGAEKDQEPCPFVLNRADVCKSFNLLSTKPVFHVSGSKMTCPKQMTTTSLLKGLYE